MFKEGGPSPEEMGIKPEELKEEKREKTPEEKFKENCVEVGAPEIVVDQFIKEKHDLKENQKDAGKLTVDQINDYLKRTWPRHIGEITGIDAKKLRINVTLKHEPTKEEFSRSVNMIDILKSGISSDEELTSHLQETEEIPRITAEKLAKRMKLDPKYHIREEYIDYIKENENNVRELLGDFHILQELSVVRSDGRIDDGWTLEGVDEKKMKVFVSKISEQEGLLFKALPIEEFSGDQTKIKEKVRG